METTFQLTNSVFSTQVLCTLMKLSIDAFELGDLALSSRLRNFYDSLKREIVMSTIPKQQNQMTPAQRQVDNDTASSSEHLSGAIKSESEESSTNQITTSSPSPNSLENVTNTTIIQPMMPQILQNQTFIHENDKKSVETYELDLENGKAILQKLNHQNTGFLTVYPSQETQNTVRDIQGARMTGLIASKGVIESCQTVNATFVKNFPKLVGDHFANYLVVNHRMEGAKTVFKDKCSWKKLNDYLNGKTLIEGIDSTAMIRLFLDFLMQMSDETIDKTKTSDKDLKTCYKIVLNQLKVAVAAVKEWSLESKLKTMELKKIWPTVEIRMQLD